MVNRSKAKGTAWETRLVNYLKENGFPYATRNPLAGSKDVGDVGNIPGVVWEAKCTKTLALAQWVDEMVAEKRNAGVDIGVVCFPRRSHATERAYCLLELKDLVTLLK